MSVIVEVDPTAGATYLALSDEPVARTVSVSDLVMVDVDLHMEPVGVEFVVPPDRITDEMIRRVVDRFPTLKVLDEDRSWLYARAF